jgi:N-acetyl-anhydromuramyl-L-alanine amidase AmpD
MAVPKAWMPRANMARIHVHWTAGGYKANATDRRAYHILIEGDGKLVRGDRSIKANEKGSGMTPASHTLNANPGAIGVSMCCMVGARESPFDAGRAPMTRAQWDAMVAAVADLARRYNIPVSPKTILTHAEVGPNL